ncbi:3055_t:CDS:10 [Diversispora eburnea]|uniref:Dolichyl-phosphate-mannose--protein mannosyltransferase n=1 Tax=Diversispora eburnea TaxID=1213867 RepID=A0A9N8V574_9GLOM|nr:3055_t:CDS:10 [Diversispora eburnea]
MTFRNRQEKQSGSLSGKKQEYDFDDKKKEFIVQFSDKKDDTLSLIVLAVLTFSAFVTRFWMINHPDQVVFDEVHFGKFASFYLRREYYFDVHPPLAKLMLAGMGWLLGYDGHFEFDNIGDDYITNDVPYVGFRALPATLGALFVPLTYMIMKESGYPIVTSLFAAGLVLFDNALICQTRLILLDSMLVFFMLCTFYCYIRFYKLRLREFSNEWYIWLVACGVSLGLTLSVKMVGLFTVATIGYAVLNDLWNLLDINRGLSMTQFKKHFFVRALGLIVVPLSIYLFWFYIHFLVLSKSGAGDGFMSPAFQETLEGNVMSLQSYVFLHSHLARYPLRYDDGRISSAGQQVTGYPFDDINNHWRIIPAEGFFDTSRPENDTIYHGDHILLEHINTKTILLTHDVASPTMPTNQEFTTIAANDTSRYNETVFQILINDGDEDTVWKTKSSHFRLIHYDTNVALWTHKKNLPEWDTENLEPKPLKHIPFYKKFFELQRLMISHNSGLTKPHPYSSGPINWPFLVRGISFWTLGDKKQQIYLLGNPFTWWISIGSIAVLVGVVAADLISRRRGVQPIPDPVRNRLYNSAGFFSMAWLFHYVPFFLMGRSLFLHHYLPGLICSYLVAAAVFQFMFISSINYPVSVGLPYKSTSKIVLKAKVDYIAKICCTVLLSIAGIMFIYFAPMTYGTPGLEPDDISHRQWLETWDFHFQTKKG